MTSKLRAVAIGAVLALPLCVQAQQALAPANPADPAVTVPPTVYTPSPAAYSHTPQDDAITPDKAWRAANDTVAAAPGHGGHDAHRGEPKSPGHEAPRGPAAPTVHPKPAAAPPVDHSKHH